MSALIKDMVWVIEAAFDYIDAIPDEAASRFPAMPGFDREFANEVLAKAKIALARVSEQDYKRKSPRGVKEMAYKIKYENNTVNNFCFSCGKVTLHIWKSYPAPKKMRTHGVLTQRVGWLSCLECKKEHEQG